MVLATTATCCPITGGTQCTGRLLQLLRCHHCCVVWHGMAATAAVAPKQLEVTPRSATHCPQELIAMQQNGPKEIGFFGTRNMGWMHQQLIEVLSYAMVLTVSLTNPLALLSLGLACANAELEASCLKTMYLIMSW